MTENGKSTKKKDVPAESADAGTSEKRRDVSLIDLFLTFVKLGAFTIGGGMAMIPLMQGLIVDRKGWLTEEEMVDCLAVSQSLPGVIAINMATYIGRKKAGLKGSVVATLGVILPSLCIMICVVELLRNLADNRYVQGALFGIKSAAAGLIAYSAYKVGKQVISGGFSGLIAAASFVAVALLEVNAVVVILLGTALGVAYYRYGTKAGEKA